MADPKKLLTAVLFSVFFASVSALAFLLVPVSPVTAAAAASAVFLAISPQLVMLIKGEVIPAVLSWSAAALAAGYLIGWEGSFFLFALFAVFAAGFLFLERTRLKPAGRVAASAGVWTVLFMVFSRGWSVFSGKPLAGHLAGRLRALGALSIGAYYDHRFTSVFIEGVEGHILRNIVFFRENFTGLVIAAAFAGSWLLCRDVSLKISKMGVPPAESFRMPESFIWLLLVAGAVFAAGTRLQFSEYLHVAASNAAVVLLAGYLINGVALILVFFRGLGFSPAVKWFLIAGLIILFRGAYFFTAAGILDVWFDFRKRKPEAVK